MVYVTRVVRKLLKNIGIVVWSGLIRVFALVISYFIVETLFWFVAVSMGLLSRECVCCKKMYRGGPPRYREGVCNPCLESAKVVEAKARAARWLADVLSVGGVVHEPAYDEPVVNVLSPEYERLLAIVLAVPYHR